MNNQILSLELKLLDKKCDQIYEEETQSSYTRFIQILMNMDMCFIKNHTRIFKTHCYVYSLDRLTQGFVFYFAPQV